jgi:hypothetical protein
MSPVTMKNEHARLHGNQGEVEMENNYLKSKACNSFASKGDWPIEARSLISCYEPKRVRT